jgi:anthranilate phosphoribosyltransferase
LLNPARPECQLVGVFDRTLCPIFAEILQRLGRDSAWVVNGATADGRVVDEVSLMGPTLVCKSGNFQGQVDEELQPSDFGLEVVPATELQGGDAAENAVILEEILSGQERGPKRDIVRLNAAAAIACAGLADDMGDAFRKTGEILDNGAALDRLRILQEYGKIS